MVSVWMNAKECQPNVKGSKTNKKMIIKHLFKQLPKSMFKFFSLVVQHYCCRFGSQMFATKIKKIENLECVKSKFKENRDKKKYFQQLVSQL